jgi:hypothetical protein
MPQKQEDTRLIARSRTGAIAAGRINVIKSDGMALTT